MLLVFNPKAHNGKAWKVLPKLEAALEKAGLDVDRVDTRARGDGTTRILEADLDRYDGVLAAGGDGTVFEVVNGLFRRDGGPAVPMGIIPIGTGNAFVRDMGLDNRHWDDAVQMIAKGNTRKVDVGRFGWNGEHWYFINIIGIGFVSDVCDTAHHVKWMGNLSYSIGVLHRVAALRTFPVRLELDGEPSNRDVVFIEVSNSRYTSNFLMAPDAKIDDGKLDVTILGKVSRTRLLTAFPRIFKGTHVELDEVDSIQASRIVIDTDTHRLLTPDGELLGRSPVTIECLQQALTVFWP